MDQTEQPKLKVYLPDLPARLSDVVARVVPFVDELWMLEPIIVGEDPEDRDSYFVMSMLQNVLSKTTKGRQIQVTGVLAGRFALPKREVDSKKGEIRTLENCVEAIVDKLMAEPDIAILRAGYTFPRTKGLARLTTLLKRRASPTAPSLLKSAAVGDLVLRENLPTLVPKGLSDALELREKLSDYLIPFRESMGRFAQCIQNQEVGPEFEERIREIVTLEIQPRVREMSAVLNSPGKRILKHLVATGLHPITAGLTTLAGIASIGEGALAAATSVASIGGVVLTAALKAKQERAEILDPRKNGLALLFKLGRSRRW